MAGAPIKLGLEYGSTKTKFHHEENFEKLRIAFGPKSISFYILLQNYIFDKRGYYLQYNEENVENFLAWSKLTPWFNKQNLSEFISTAIRYGIFDKYTFETFGVLTSESIQITWNFATENRRIVRLIIVDYWLLASRQVDKRELLMEQILQNKTKVTLYIKKEDVEYVENLIIKRATYSNAELSSANLDEKEPQIPTPKESRISYENFLQNKRYQRSAFCQQVRASSVRFKDVSDIDIEMMLSTFCARNMNSKAPADFEHKIFLHFINWLDRASTPKPKTNEKPKPTPNPRPGVGQVQNSTKSNTRYGETDF